LHKKFYFFLQKMGVTSLVRLDNLSQQACHS
jgi:hypothetical protein